MKELTVEQKAKRYDEAIERAKEFKEHLLEINEKDYADEMDYVFPELAESDDEKIRKALIDYFRWNPNSQLLNEFTNREVFAWLEKQGKQRLYINDNAKEMFIKALERVEEQNDKGYKLTDCDKNSWWKDFKAYTSCTIEQKPAEWSEEDENRFNRICGALKRYEMSLGASTNDIEWLKDRVKPKREWSEEDENRFNNLCLLIDGSNDNELTKNGFKNWLKSFKNSVQLKSTEWSEGDEITRKALINLVEMYYGDCIDKTEKNRLLNFLKSIRPQSQWKPSDAQMASITCAVRNMKESACYDSELVSLLNDLKNLK